MDDAERHILIVEDDETHGAALSVALAAAGYAVQRSTDAVSGLLAVEARLPAAIVLDWQLPFVGGQLFVRALREGLETPPPVVAIDGSGDPAVALAAGAAAVLAPSDDPTLVVRAVRTLLTPEAGPSHDDS